MRIFLTILGIAGGVVALLILGAGIAVWTVDPNDLAGPLQARLKAAIGRDVTIGGAIELELGLVPKLVVNDVHVASASWAKRPELLSAKRVEVEVALLPLLQRRFQLTRVNLIEPVIALETNAKGRGNWEPAESTTPSTSPASTATSASGLATLGLDNLGIRDGALTYYDGASGAETHVAIYELMLRARDAQSPVNAEFRGTVDGIAVAVTGNLGPLEALVERRVPYAVELNGEVNGRKSAMQAKILRADTGVSFQDIDLTSGSSAMKGQIEIRSGGSKPIYIVDIVSPMLSLDELTALAVPAPPQVANASGSAEKAADGARRVLSDSALPLASLLAKDVDGKVAIDKLVLRGGRRIDNVRAQFNVRDGKLDAPALQASAFGGTISGSLKVDAAGGRTPSVVLRVDGRDFDLGLLLAASGVTREVRNGKTNVAVNVTTHGSSLHQWASAANGQAQVTVGAAVIVNAKLDPTLPFDRMVAAVNPLRVVDGTTELRCAVIRLPIANGVAKIDRSIGLEARQLDASVSGTLDFRNETLDLSIHPRFRQGVTIDIPEVADLVRIRGSFAAPSVGVDPAASTAAVASIVAAVSTQGLSLIGQTIAGSGGAGACETALGTAIANRAGSHGASAPTSAVESLGRALGSLLKR